MILFSSSLSSAVLPRDTKGTQKSRALERLGVRFEDFHFDTVLVDPPRSGVDPSTCELLSRFRHIVYFSCSLETLRRDLAVLTQTHRITRVAAFDQFPGTRHLESGAASWGGYQMKLWVFGKPECCSQICTRFVSHGQMQVFSWCGVTTTIAEKPLIPTVPCS